MVLGLAQPGLALTDTLLQPPPKKAFSCGAQAQIGIYRPRHQGWGRCLPSMHVLGRVTHSGSPPPHQGQPLHTHCPPLAIASRGVLLRAQRSCSGRAGQALSSGVLRAGAVPATLAVLD